MTEINPDLYVTIKCNKCGREVGFFPKRVVYFHGCDCGNTDYGLAHKDWANDKFGNFTLIKKEIWKLPHVPQIFGL